ncbi:hypothetical protein FOPG_04113 [Fusarium oxysporum f. sp. conglutinans race 2 54008]|uniref:Uncharacterized protein n=1 Tax=Fusarium oxysporum f. sp. conglutinans race 2 54008 TaxID=1089457 RepID=X0IGQ9_FUSOX|nr:hypothetical protein FOPG_04113 [Fusarium oxysporum f. sp. conglutinans race 2 54008]
MTSDEHLTMPMQNRVQSISDRTIPRKHDPSKTDKFTCSSRKPGTLKWSNPACPRSEKLEEQARFSSAKNDQAKQY